MGIWMNFRECLIRRTMAKLSRKVSRQLSLENQMQKSSLMNVLLGENRAIVTELRNNKGDTLEENVSIHGIPLNIIDTAGIRQDGRW